MEMWATIIAVPCQSNKKAKKEWCKRWRVWATRLLFLPCHGSYYVYIQSHNPAFLLATFLLPSHKPYFDVSLYDRTNLSISGILARLSYSWFLLQGCQERLDDCLSKEKNWIPKSWAQLQETEQSALDNLILIQTKLSLSHLGKLCLFSNSSLILHN